MVTGASKLEKPLASLLVCLFLAVAVTPLSMAKTPKDPQVDVRLVFDVVGDLALVFDIEPGWHIYWHNPGDSGMATTATVHPLHQPPRFPGPERFVEPDTGFVTYGYSGRTALFFPVPEAADATGFQAEARWLACKQRCVSQSAKVRLSSPDPVDLSAIRGRLPERIEPAVSYRRSTAVVVLGGGPFQLFPPVALEERLAGSRSTPAGLELDLLPGAATSLPVVLQRSDSRFVAFDLPSPPNEE